MDLNQGLVDLVVVALVAALAPLVVAALPGPRIPQVVIFLLGGVLIGPHVLGLAETSNIQLLANIGLGFLFLLAGRRDTGGDIGHRDQPTAGESGQRAQSRPPEPRPGVINTEDMHWMGRSPTAG